MFAINGKGISTLAEKWTREGDSKNRHNAVEITEHLRNIAELKENEAFIDANGWHAVDILKGKIEIIKKGNKVLIPTIAERYTRPAIGGGDGTQIYTHTSSKKEGTLTVIRNQEKGGGKYLNGDINNEELSGVVLVVMVGGGGGGTSGAVGKGGGGGGGGESVGFLIDINAMEVGDRIKFNVGAGGAGGKGIKGSYDLNSGEPGGNTSISYKKKDENDWTVKFIAQGGKGGAAGIGGFGGGTTSQGEKSTTWEKLPNNNENNTPFQLLYRHSGKNGRKAESEDADSVSNVSGLTYYNDAMVTLYGLASGQCYDTAPDDKHTGGGGGACGNLIYLHKSGTDCGGDGAAEYTDGDDGVGYGGGGGGGGGYNLLFTNLDPRNGGNGKDGCVYIYRNSFILE